MFEMDLNEKTTINVEYNGQVYEVSNLSKEFADYLCRVENNAYLKQYMEQIVVKKSSHLEERSDFSAGKDAAKISNEIENDVGNERPPAFPSTTTTPKGKRKYTSYQKLDESDQNSFDESLVALVMDKPELYNMKLDASKKSKEKVALAWIEIQESLNTDYSQAEYTIDELKGRWTSLKSGYMQRKKKKKSGDGAYFDPVTSKLDMLMAGLVDLSLVKETQSNLSNGNTPNSKSNGNTPNSKPSATNGKTIARDLAGAAYANSFFNDCDERSEDESTPPGSSKKGSKNEIGEKFLKCFTELKHIQRLVVADAYSGPRRPVLRALDVQKVGTVINVI